ncbi:MAG: AAA family ATPase [Deltaproteobacteria bacterium]|nr:AAA family ATPase [Deltaproteobacteria bacterium]
MISAPSVSPQELLDVLLHVAPVRPVFIWGQPGIGKSALVEQFAFSVGLECVSLLGSQLAPEDIIGVPRIVDGCSVFCPPRNIARQEAYCLFLDELNSCSMEVQKAFYSLIHEQRLGEYKLPKGSIVVGAGNRAQDSAIVKPMSSALINRMAHFQLKVSSRQWLEWAGLNGIHPLIMEYVGLRPDHLWSKPPKLEEPFSTPRSWHILSDAMKEYGQEPRTEDVLRLAKACLSPNHAIQFNSFIKQVRNRYQLSAILSGKAQWPEDPENRDVLFFLAQSLRAQLVKELPQEKKQSSSESLELANNAKRLIKDLSRISLEMAQMTVAVGDDSEGKSNELPDWFLVELIRDLPKLAKK